MSQRDRLLWEPYKGAQSDFMACGAYEALFGGASGPGKSSALLALPLRWIGVAEFRALLLRRTFPELQRSLIEKSRTLYPAGGGSYNEQTKVWRFPSGAVIEFGHLEHDHDVHNYQSAEYQFIGFDELTTFSEHQYTYMLSRARSSSGIPIRIRAATNPGGSGHDWVFRRWAPWLDPGCSVKAKGGQVLRYENTDDGERWSAQGPLSRVFFPARVTDNPHLMKSDPGYLERLKGLDPVTRAQLLNGDWLARPAAGAYFKRDWLTVTQARASSAARRVRYWDRAATEAHKGSDPDYTVGLLVAHENGVFTVEDMVRLRGGPGTVEATIKQTAMIDPPGTMIGIEQDPGQAGKVEAHYYVRELAGHNVRCFPVTRDKITRAQPASAQAERGNIRLVSGPWIAPLLSELEAFPEANHDDIVDALSGAINALTSRAPARYIESKETGERRI